MTVATTSEVFVWMCGRMDKQQKVYTCRRSGYVSKVVTPTWPGKFGSPMGLEIHCVGCQRIEWKCTCPVEQG